MDKPRLGRRTATLVLLLVLLVLLLPFLAWVALLGPSDAIANLPWLPVLVLLLLTEPSHLLPILDLLLIVTAYGLVRGLFRALPRGPAAAQALADAGASTPDVRCPSCGQDVPTSFDVCWSCGIAMTDPA